MEVSYHTDRATSWRCNLKLIFISRSIAIVWLVNIAGGGLLGSIMFPASRWAGYIGATGTLLFTVVATLGQLWVNINRRFPRPDSTRACTTRLDKDGIQDTSPNGIKFIPWPNVSTIRLSHGDAFFRPRTGNGFFIPRSAFTSEAHAREYVGEARRFQRMADRVPVQRLAFEKNGVQSDTEIKPIQP